ncbi:Optic atrophy 3-like [Penicillium camemberti]|uniref:Optic atrophy 3-like n=1 Tax=Penicillium camemberti (strain FM 013) TaxID=1429867 RepID=A0A0G4PEF7_PENC3|nr:Optic atrophy 3-like [Penicillium camemberti]
MSLTLKLSSLAIRTLSKPIASQIKAQAREHERFRKICVSMAQALHRFDMRLRLGSIRDTAASQRQAAAAAEARKHKPTIPTVRNAADTKAAEDAEAKAKAAAEEAAKPHHYRIRPLSESKAIESGANFISESFLFLVAGGLILFESWRSRNKESTRREGVEGRLADLEQSEQAAREALVALEKELLQLRAKHGDLPKLSTKRILSPEIYEQPAESDIPEVPQGWLSRISSYISFGQSAETTTESVPNTQPTTENAAPTTQTPDQSAVSAGQTPSSASKSS